MMSRKRQIILSALPAVIALILFFILPLLSILFISLKADGLKYYLKFFSDKFYLNILWTTVWISLAVTLITLLLGYPTAYFLARTQSKFKSLLMIVVIFPFLVSSVVRSYGWMVILGNNGLLNQFLLAIGLIRHPLVIMNTYKAVIIGLVHLLLPYMIFSITGVLNNIDENVELAASSLGCSPIATFFKITFPLSSPGAISGCILVFILSMTSYVTPQLLGGSKLRMMSTMIYQQINITFNWNFACALSYILLGIILLFLFVTNILTSGLNKRVGGGKRE